MAARAAPLQAVLAQQADRWPLLFPIALMAGAAVWMSAERDPPLWIALAVFGASFVVIAGGWVFRRWIGATGAVTLALAGVLGCVALGALAAQLRTHLVQSPKLERVVEDGLVTGVVLEAVQGVERPRMTLRVNAIEGVASPPLRVSLSTLAGAGFPPGRAIQCRAFLAPPEGPIAPHAYDAARSAYFDQIGASGFTLGRCRPIPAPLEQGFWAGLEVQIAAWRRALSEAIYAAAPHDGGAVAAALVTGDRSLMSAEAVTAFRDSGLGHLLSVSGLHMSLVGGGVFAALWFALALTPKLALFAPIKKIAALGALIALSAYLLVSGMSVPAIRAFVMAGVAFGAVLIDRPAISMRGLAAALGIVVLLLPDSVLEPGFQMSFAATAGLVALFEMQNRRREIIGDPGKLIGAIQWGWASIATVLTISLVAGLATDPFALYHFQRLTMYGLPANLATAPIISFIVAPTALVAAALAPFGFAQPVLGLMADALLLVVGIGAMFASRPEAVLSLPAISPDVFVCTIIGMIWLATWQGALRWAGLGFLSVALALWLQASPSVVLFDADLRAVVFRERAQSAEDSGWRAAARARGAAFAQGRLGALAGLTPKTAEALGPAQQCIETPGACTWRTPGGSAIALAATPQHAAVLCADHALVLLATQSDDQVRQTCPPNRVIDADDRARLGGGVVRERDGILLVERAHAWAGERPWTGPLMRPTATPKP